MPIYEYAPTSGQCEKCSGLFEVVQRMADARLVTCPTCGQPCERRISAVALGGTYSVSDDKIKNSGLTKYKKAGDGVYERTAGSGGPEVIVRK
ncbi:MAG: zinc ribbon domain-containing protein [Betaproteobacteria bacterium]|nr:MAG: zinc ribbon domain-containing protein [Betaproteobacteria bacterium]